MESCSGKHSYSVRFWLIWEENNNISLGLQFLFHLAATQPQIQKSPMRRGWESWRWKLLLLALDHEACVISARSSLPLHSFHHQCIFIPPFPSFTWSVIKVRSTKQSHYFLHTSLHQQPKRLKKTKFTVSAGLSWQSLLCRKAMPSI